MVMVPIQKHDILRMLLFILYDFHEVILQVHKMNVVIRVKVIPDEDIDTIFVNETLSCVSSMNITDDVVCRHGLFCSLKSAKIKLFYSTP